MRSLLPILVLSQRQEQLVCTTNPGQYRACPMLPLVSRATALRSQYMQNDGSAWYEENSRSIGPVDLPTLDLLELGLKDHGT